MGGISVWQLLILLVIVLLLFGTKRIRNLGSDLGSAIKGFRKGLNEDDEPQPRLEADPEETTESSETREESGSRHSS